MNEDLKAKLLAKRNETASGMPQESVPVDGMGEVIVRGLSRGEVFFMQKCKQDGGIKTEQEWERRMFSIALVDPEMTEAEVGEWQSVSPAGEMEPVGAKIRELSKLDDGADKSDVSSVRDESGTAV